LSAGTGAGGAGILAIGTVPYVNAWPLVAGFEGRKDVRLIAESPARLRALLASGEADVCLLPVAELLRDPELEIVSAGCIASLGPVDSVLLLLRRAPARIRSLTLDPHSRTSQVLARLLLARCWNAHPHCVEEDPREAWELGGTDAVLAIGDAALALRFEGHPFLDLGSAWTAHTGLPFVYAVWAARRATLAARPEMPEQLAGGRVDAPLELDLLVARAARKTGLSEAAVGVYLRKRIRYRLAASERRGLDRFLSLAREALVG
jgi:predicted solute-binding protein